MKAQCIQTSEKNQNHPNELFHQSTLFHVSTVGGGGGDAAALAA